MRARVHVLGCSRSDAYDSRRHLAVSGPFVRRIRVLMKCVSHQAASFLRLGRRALERSQAIGGLSEDEGMRIVNEGTARDVP